MIHDLIDSRKKAIRNNPNKNSKTLNENKPCCDNLNLDYSDNEGKEAETSNTFIPPWLRNSLGLNQRSNQNLDWNLCLPNFNALGHVISDQKSARTTVPKYKEPNSNQSNDLKTNVGLEDPSNVDRNDVNFQKNSETEVTEDQSQDGIPVGLNEKPILSSRHYPYKELEEQSVYMKADKVLIREDSKTSNVPITSADSDKVREERKKIKFIKQKKKIKKHISDQTQDLHKNDVDFLLGTNAREILDNYVKKDVHSVSSDLKQLEAKLILLNEKYQKADLSKLSHQEFRLLQEIKEQTGSRENFEKLMNHIKETNLREILKSTNAWTKLIADKNKTGEDFTEKDEKKCTQFFGIEENGSRIINDRDSLVSTDDETDIKRFSEFLSKNKNLDEKKKCLEEVRNYFERKRRTRLTKRRCMDENKNLKYSSSQLPDKKDDLPRERPKSTDVTPVSSSKEKKNKVSICEEEIVEKAVSETLQKFVNLYHFHVSPTMMGSLRKNILEAIQSDSYDSNQFKKSLPVQSENKGNFDESVQSKTNLKNEDTIESPAQQDSTPIVEKIENKDNLLLPLNKEGKKKNFKVIMDNSESQIQKPLEENNIDDSESIKRLQKDFENCIKSIQSHTDVSKLKLQSVILEKKDHDSTTKGLQFVYNFTKKSLESVSKEVPESKKKKDCETQVKIIQKSVKIQPSRLFERQEKNMQTDEPNYLTKSVQTEGRAFGLKEMKELKGFDITPGLYRLVKSKDVSRFYLYPENSEKSPYTSISNETDSSVFKCKECENKNVETTNFKKSLNKKSDKETRIIYRNRDRSRFFRTRRKNYMGNSSQKFPKKLFINTKSEDPLKCLYFENSINESQSVVGSISNTDEAMFFNDHIEVDSVVNPSTNQHLGCFWFWNGEKINSGCDLKMHVENLLKEKLKELVFPQIFSKPNQFLQNACEGIQKYNDKTSENVSQFQGNKCEKINESRHKSALFCFKKNIAPLTGSAPIIASGKSDFLNDNKSNVEGDNVIKKEDLEKLENSINNNKVVKEVGIQNSLQALSSINLTKIKSRTSSFRSTKIRQKKKKSSIKVLGDQKNEICTFKTVADFQEALEKIKKTPLKNSLTWILELDNKSDNNKPEHTGKFRNFFSLVDQEVQTNNILQLVQEGLNEKPAQESLIGNLKHWELIEKVLNKVSQKEQETLWNDVREFIKEKIGTDINDEGAKEVCIEIEHDVPNSGSGKSKQAIVAKGHYKKSEGDIEVEVDLTLEDLEKILQRRQKKTRRRQVRYSGRGKNLFTTSSAQTYQEELAKYQKYLKYEKFSTLGGGLMSEKELKILEKNTFT